MNKYISGYNSMTIGILTFWWSQDNYGQVLQCYALQKFLRDLGHEAFLIRYNNTNDLKRLPLFLRLLKAFNPVILYKYLKKKIRFAKVLNEQIEYNRHFDDFRKKYIPFSGKEYTSFKELKQNPPAADVYIVGSDQVWNYWNMRLWCYKNPIHAYFLDFGSDSTKRLSYAASWGRKELSEEYKEEIVPMLAKFNYISVREQNGIDLCAQCGKNDAEWVCDPTLILSAEKYRELYQNENVRKQSSKYLFLYMLNNKFSFDIQKIYDFAQSKGLEVVYITGNGKIDKYPKYFATIPEWLYLVDNAEYVITNSFHCSVFSTIFNKKFGIVPLCDKDEGMNARFDSLLDLRGIDKHYIFEDDFSAIEKEYTAKDIEVSGNFLNILQ